MTAARWLLLGGAVVCLLIGYALGTLGKASNAEIDSAHDSTRVAVDRAAAAEKARAEFEVVARADSARLTHRADSALSVARAASARRPQVIDRIVLREQPQDTTVARRVATAVADSLNEHEIRPRDVTIAQKDSLLVSRGTLLLATQSALEASRTAGERQAVEITALRSARPSWAKRQAPKLTLVAGAAAGWFAYRYSH